MIRFIISNFKEFATPRARIKTNKITEDIERLLCVLAHTNYLCQGQGNGLLSERRMVYITQLHNCRRRNLKVYKRTARYNFVLFPKQTTVEPQGNVGLRESRELGEIWSN